MTKKVAVGASILIALLTLGVVSASPSSQTSQPLTVERSEDRLSAVASWTPSPGAEEQLFLYMGKLLLGENDPTGLGIHLGSYRESELPGSQNSLDISDLDPRREYIYAVARVDRDDDGKPAWSDWKIAGNILPPPGSASMDRDALVALYNATDGENWRNKSNWLSDAPLGDWHGVKTDAGGRVVEINLMVNNLDGELPPELGNLARLERLVLMLNRLSGDLPPELGMLSKLEELVLVGNQLTGEVPVQLGGLTNLEKLYLSVGNQFVGCVPSVLRIVPENDMTALNLPFCS